MASQLLIEAPKGAIKYLVTGQQFALSRLEANGKRIGHIDGGTFQGGTLKVNDSEQEGTAAFTDTTTVNVTFHCTVELRTLADAAAVEAFVLSGPA